MRKVTFGGANSFDNYFARNDGSVDWLIWSNEAAAFMKAYWKTIDTVLMGRKTYEVALKMGGGNANPYGGVANYVFSRSGKAKPSPGVEIVFEDAAEFVRRLKNQEGKDICVMGGGLLAKSLFEADLIDEVGFNIHPVLLGSGIPVFHEMNHQIDLELIDCNVFKVGTVMVRYRVKKKAVGRKKPAKSKGR